MATDVTFKLKLAAGYDPSTLAVVAGETLLAPINTQANDDGTTTYTYTFKATQAMTVGVRDDLAKYSYVVTMPVGHFNAALTAPTAGTSTVVLYVYLFSFTVKAQEGYEITGVYVNGDELTANAGVYTVEDVKTAQNVEVLVKEIPNYTVTYVVNNTSTPPKWLPRAVRSPTCPSRLMSPAMTSKAGTPKDSLAGKATRS